MATKIAVSVLPGAALLLGLCHAAFPQTGQQVMSVSVLRDKIEGGWAGQMIGVSYGAPTEFKSLGQIIVLESIPAWTPDRVRNALGQDDLYVDMSFAKVLDVHGLDASSEDFGEMLKNTRYNLAHANLAARRALRRGAPAALAGTPQYNIHANDIDFQIEADFIGLMAPGLFRASNDLCMRVGRVVNSGDGIYGGMFIAGMYAAAFFERDPRRIVQAGLAVLPPRSSYARLISDVLAWSNQHPEDWEAVWRRMEEKWNRDEPCPEGAFRPFNIDAKLNGGYVALGLLYGRGDLARTLEIATRAGQDSDCNPASAAGILGVVLGYRQIPEIWKAGIPAIAHEKFRFTDFDFRSIVDSTVERALALIQRTGGTLEGGRLTVKVQTPQPLPLETWNPGKPVERIALSDPRWRLKGSWAGYETPWQNGSSWGGKRTNQPGAEASVSFEGKGAVLVGPYYVSGGKADIYVDGNLKQTIDAYETRNRYCESLWHHFGLRNGKHTLRVVVRGEPYGNSKGADFGLVDLVVFR